MTIVTTTVTIPYKNWLYHLTSNNQNSTKLIVTPFLFPYVTDKISNTDAENLNIIISDLHLLLRIDYTKHKRSVKPEHSSGMKNALF